MTSNISHKNKKILFVLPSLVAGGAERIMSFVSQEIDTSKFDAELLLTGFEKDTFYDVHKVKVTYLNKSRVLHSIWPLYQFIRQSKPDIVLSSISHLNSILGLISIFFPRIKFIGREANVLSVVKAYKGHNTALYNAITKISYRFLDMIICQSKDMKNDMQKNFGIPAEKLKLINNPITNDFHLKGPSDKKHDKIQFITVASLKSQKGHERILKVLGNLDFDFTYLMIGDGPERERLKTLMEDLGIGPKITHIPHTKEVATYLAQSDLFLQGSYVEGFPNCLLESCSVGTPIVAFDAYGGLDEIIEIGVNGFIAKDETAYGDLIRKAIDETTWNPEKIRHSVHKKFSKEKILRAYEKLFLDVLA